MTLQTSYKLIASNSGKSCIIIAECTCSILHTFIVRSYNIPCKLQPNTTINPYIQTKEQKDQLTILINLEHKDLLKKNIEKAINKSIDRNSKKTFKINKLKFLAFEQACIKSYKSGGIDSLLDLIIETDKTYFKFSIHKATDGDWSNSWNLSASFDEFELSLRIEDTALCYKDTGYSLELQCTNDAIDCGWFSNENEPCQIKLDLLTKIIKMNNT